MNFNIINTERLLLRPFQNDDVVSLYDIQCNPESMQYTFCASSLNESKERLQAYAAQLHQYGYAPWTILLKSNQKIIGWGGLNIDPFDPGWGIEVAYFFHPDCWGKGFATELVQTTIDHGFIKLGLSEINAYAHKNNSASIRVLEKCSFRFVGYESKLDRNRYKICA